MHLRGGRARYSLDEVHPDLRHIDLASTLEFFRPLGLNSGSLLWFPTEKLHGADVLQHWKYPT